MNTTYTVKHIQKGPTLYVTDNSLAVVRHGWILGGVLNVDFGVVNLDGEFARFDFTKELK